MSQCFLLKTRGCSALLRAAHRNAPIGKRYGLALGISRHFSVAANPASLLRTQASPAPLVYMEGYIEVEEVQGMRVRMEGETPRVDYLVKWKDGSENTWEPAINLSEDLVRDYEDKWWQAARKADLQVLGKMLGGGKDALALVVDENGRSALHFAAALGSVDCVKLLVEAGADVNLQDKEGYTPLHMASGYMHTRSMAALLEAGADPEIKDVSGKDAVQLVDNLRKTVPLSARSITQRIALEQVSSVLTNRIFEEVPPAQILNVRKRESDGQQEFLIKFADGREDEWVDERDMAPGGADGREDEWVEIQIVVSDVLQDYRDGLEYATAEKVLDVVQVGTARRFKVAWSDGYPASWEPEEHLPADLIALFQQQNPELFEQRTAAGTASDAEAGLQAWPMAADFEWSEPTEHAQPREAAYQTQYAPLQVVVKAPPPVALGAAHNGNGNGAGSASLDDSPPLGRALEVSR